MSEESKIKKMSEESKIKKMSEESRGKRKLDSDGLTLNAPEFFESFLSKNSNFWVRRKEGVSLPRIKNALLETTEDPLPYESVREGQQECNHTFILKDDLGYVCRICGVIQRGIKTINDYQYAKDSKRFICVANRSLVTLPPLPLRHRRPAPRPTPSLDTYFPDDVIRKIVSWLPTSEQIQIQLTSKRMFGAISVLQDECEFQIQYHLLPSQLLRRLGQYCHPEQKLSKVMDAKWSPWLERMWIHLDVFVKRTQDYSIRTATGKQIISTAERYERLGL